MRTTDTTGKTVPACTTRTERGPARTARSAAVVVTKDGLPAWLDPVVHAVETVEPLQLSRFLPPADGAGRQSAVLILFGEGARGPSCC